MDLNTNYGKTGRGLRASTKKLPKDAGKVLSVLDSDLTAEQILFKLPRMKAKDFEAAMSWLIEGGFIKAVEREEFPQSMWDASKLAAVEVDEIDIDQFTISEKRTDSQADALNAPKKKRARPTIKTEDLEKIKVLEKADEEARQRAEAALQAKLEAENVSTKPNTMEPAIDTAKQEAEEAKLKAEEKARIKAEKEAEAQAQKEADALRKAEEKAKKEEEAKRLAEEKAAEEARKQTEKEAKAKAEAEEAKLKAEEKARIKAEKEAEAQAQKEADALRKAEEKAKKEEEAKRLAEEKAAEEARKQTEKEAKAKAEAEEKARKAEEAKLKAEEKARIKAEKEAEAQAQKEADALRKAEEKAKKEAEAKRLAEEKAAEEARKQTEKEAKAKAEAEEKARKAEEAKLKAEEKARIKAEKEAEAQAQKEADALRKAEEKAKKEAEAKRLAEEKLAAKEKARLEAEERAILKAEQKAEAKTAAEKKALEKAAEKEHAKLEAAALKEVRAKKKAEAKIEARYRRQEIISNIKGVLPGTSWLTSLSNSIKPISMFAIAVLFLLIIAAQFINMSILIAPIEKIASQNIQDPVNIESVNVSLFPRPHFLLKDITIADTSSINLKRVRVYPNLLSLKDKFFKDASSSYQIESIEIEQFNIAQKDIYRISSWAGATTRDQKVQLKLIKINDLAFNMNKIEMPKLDAVLTLDAAGLLKTAKLSGAEKRLQININRANSDYIVDINAQRWRLPIYPHPVLTKLTAKGSINDDAFILNNISGTLYNGSLTGKLETDLTSTTLVSKGNFNVESLYVGDMADELKLNTHVDGKLNINGDFSFDINKLANTMLMRDLQAKFIIDDGRLRKVNIGEAMRSGNLSGITDFVTLKGNIALNNQSYQFSGLALKDKQLFANGYINLSPDYQVSGVVNAKIAMRRPISARLAIIGSLNALRLKR